MEISGRQENGPGPMFYKTINKAAELHETSNMPKCSGVDLHMVSKDSLMALS